MIWFIIIPVIIFFLIPFLDGWSGKHKLSKLYGVTYIDQANQEETSEQEEQEDELKTLNKLERIDIQEKTLVQYNKLLDNLAGQYMQESDEKKKAAILSKQIVTLEKYNKALEKMEKLDN